VQAEEVMAEVVVIDGQRPPVQAVIFDFFGVVRVEAQGGAVINQPLLEFIAQLKKSYKIALLSNTGSSRISDFLTPAQQGQYFDVIVTSQESGYLKPDAEAYLITARRLGVAPQECIMIDDISSHCQGARTAGMKAIQYISFKQLQEELNRLLP